MKNRRSPLLPQGDLPLPRDRDESPSDQVSPPNEVIRQAAQDIEQGQVDTDLHATPGIDAEQRGKLLDESARASRKQAAASSRPKAGEGAEARQDEDGPAPGR